MYAYIEEGLFDSPLVFNELASEFLWSRPGPLQISNLSTIGNAITKR